MKQNESAMIPALTEFYRRNGILSTEFNCKHAKDCQGDRESLPKQFVIVPDESVPQKRERIAGKFVQAKAASVGDRYESCRMNGVRIPRLMFVSADPGSSIYSDGRNWVPAENRTPESVQRIRCQAELRPSGSAGVWQHKIACRIFGEFGVVDAPKYAAPYFANVNAAKCCENKTKSSGNDRNNELASPLLFANCREYLRGEIEVLRPDVIVSQGKDAMESVGLAFSVPFESGRAQIVSLRGEGRAFWLPTHHPNSGRHFHQQRNGAEWGKDWEGLAKRIRDFISNRDS